jgi:predicted CoA-binding protein
MNAQELPVPMDKIISVNGQNVLLNLRAVDETIDVNVLLERGLSKINQVTENPYTLVVLPANDLKIPIYQMSSIYSKLPRQVRKNLKKLCILEPSWLLRVYFNVLIFMASPKFFRKIKWVDDQFIAPYFYTFGVDLSALMTDQLILPRVVQDSVAVISRNIQVVGLFRVTPSVKVLGKVKEAYDNGDPKDLAVDVLDDVHVACSLLKMFVRELPEAIILADLYPEVIALSGLFICF